MPIQRSREEFRSLIDILRQMHDFDYVRDRRRLVEAQNATGIYDRLGH